MAWTDLKSNYITGDQFPASAANAIAAAINAIVDNAVAATVATSETTTSTTYADLTTTTDSVTATIGSSGKALVIIGATLSSSTTAVAAVGFAISGATTQAAADTQNLQYTAPFASNNAQSFGRSFLLTGLAAGSTTFKMKYKAQSASTATFANRHIIVIALP
jgi:hypothetical protein